QLENVLQVAAEYAPHELVTYGLPGHSHQPITHGRLRAIQPKIRMVQ
ncbi:shufflon protein B', partial [Escherichia coli R424]